MTPAEKRLIAIRDPAPSIPVEFRLYHGGSPKRGALIPHSSRALSYVGDYVYFSVNKRYAQQYVNRRSSAASPKRKSRRSDVFIIDARLLPSDSLIVRAGSGSKSSLEEALACLVEARHALEWLLKLCREKGVTRLKDLQEFERITLPFASRLESHSQAKFAGVDAIMEGTSFVFFYYGRLDLEFEELVRARQELQVLWCRGFTTPFDVCDLESAKAANASKGPSSRDPSLAQGRLIVLVPGKIPVLPNRFLDPPHRRKGP